MDAYWPEMYLCRGLLDQAVEVLIINATQFQHCFKPRTFRDNFLRTGSGIVMHLAPMDSSSPEMYVYRQICVHYSAIIVSNPTQLSPLILAVHVWHPTSTYRKWNWTADLQYMNAYYPEIWDYNGILDQAAEILIINATQFQHCFKPRTFRDNFLATGSGIMSCI